MINVADLQHIYAAYSDAACESWPGATSLSDTIRLSALEELLFSVGTFPPDTVYAVRAPDPAIDLAGRGVEDALQAFAEGRTLIVRSLHRRWAQVADVAGAIGHHLGVDARVNAYLTPPGARGFSKHFDDHDVVLIQCFGEKEWDIFERVSRLPMESIFLSDLQKEALRFNADLGHDALDNAPKLRRETLVRDRLLYLPRGVPHQGIAGAGGSLHLSVALIKPSVAEVLSLARLRRDVQRNSMSAHWRPDAFVEEARDAHALSQDVREVEISLQITRRQARRPLPGQLLESICNIDMLTSESIVRRRRNLHPWMGAVGSKTVFMFLNQKLDVPPELLSTFEYLTRTQTFSPTLLPVPSDLDPLEFVKDLIRLGLLEQAPNVNGDSKDDPFQARDRSTSEYPQ